MIFLFLLVYIVHLISNFKDLLNKKITLITIIYIIRFLIIIISYFLRKKTFIDKEKTTPFECGFDPSIITRIPFSLRFFKISIIFIIFDIEIVLILPLPLTNNHYTTLFLNSSNTIIIIIILGLLYE